MKRLLWIVISLLVPSAVSADVVGVYADPTGYCLLLDTPGPKTLYVLQKFTLGSVASRFRVELSPGFTGSLVSTSGGIVEGDLMSGATVTYPDCQSGTVEVLDLQFMMLGTSTECSWVRIAPHPLSPDGLVDVYSCDMQRNGADWQGTHVQHSIFLFCPDLFEGENHNPPSCTPFTPPLATEAATWGRVKALYR